MYPESECAEVINYQPESCSSCGGQLEGEDANPYRHQQVEIPPIKTIVIEHRLHQLECGECNYVGRISKEILSKYPSVVEYPSKLVQHF
ncbi:hypothetical protein FJR05_12910 [Dolichospermum sp. UHCC 0259]|nr:hypothetical protein [Dolichospermum sp. UHCC 0259]